MISNASQSDIKAAFDGAAVYTNRFIVTINNFGVRIAFIEQNSVGEEPQSKLSAAVVMTRDDAVALVELISKMLTTPTETKQ